MEQEPTYVGIDVAKARVDVAVCPSGDIWSVDYDETGVAGLVDRLQAMRPAAVLLEATGGLEVPLVSALAAAALPVVVVNPRQVRDFAKATGRLAKTDALDAQVLAHFAEAVRPPVRQLRDEDTQELNAMTTRRNQMMTMLVSEKNRLSRAIPSVLPSIQAHIAWLEQKLKDLDDGLRQTLRRSPVWREKDDLLRSVPRCGGATLADALGVPARIGHAEPQANRCSGRRGSHQPGQRDHAGPPRRLGRPSASANGPLHGRAGRQQAQPGDPRVLSAVAGRRQVQESRPYGVHAEASGHTQRHGKERTALGSRDRRGLTSKTVAMVYWPPNP